MTEQHRRKLKVDLGELIVAFDSSTRDLDYCLDLETGDVLVVTGDTRYTLENLRKSVSDPSPDALLSAIEELEYDWQKEMLEVAVRVESDLSRYISVPHVESREGYREMQDFIITVEDEHLQVRLESAIQGRGAFRRFKDVLNGYPQERERWFRFRDERLEQRGRDWLQAHDIEPDLTP